MYIPKSKYKSGFYALHGEFKLKSSGEIYEGPYFKTIDSKIFTGDSPNRDSQEIIPIDDGYSSDSINANPTQQTQYDKIRNNEDEVALKNTIKLPVHYPKPTEDQYNKGFMERYFVEDVRDLTIKEISKEDFNSVKNKESKYYYPNYRPFRLNWLIRGNVNSRVVANHVVPGISHKNQAKVLELSKKYVNLQNKLDDPLEFLG